MQCIDLDILISNVNKLSRKQKIILSLLCAEQLFPLYLKFEDANENKHGSIILRKSLDFIWDYLEKLETEDKCQIDQSLVRGLVRECELFIPSEDEEWTDMSAYAQNSVSSVIYSLQSIISNETEQVIWCIKQVHDIADYHVHMTENIDFDDTDAEERIYSNSKLQNELAIIKRNIETILNAKKISEIKKLIITTGLLN
jgi:hypothetical protein